MSDQEIQKLETKEDAQPTEGQIQSESTAEKSHIDEKVLRETYDVLEKKKEYVQNWESFLNFYNRYPEVGEQISSMIQDTVSGKAPVKNERPMEVQKEEKKESVQTRIAIDPDLDRRLKQVEEQQKEAQRDLISARIEKSVANLAKRYGTDVMEKQGEIEQKVLDYGLLPAIQSGSLSIEKAMEIVWRNERFNDQLTKGKNEVLSEIESKRSAQGPQINKASGEGLVPAKAKSFREAFELAEKDLGTTLEDLKEKTRTAS